MKNTTEKGLPILFQGFSQSVNVTASVSKVRLHIVALAPLVPRFQHYQLIFFWFVFYRI